MGLNKEANDLYTILIEQCPKRIRLGTCDDERRYFDIVWIFTVQPNAGGKISVDDNIVLQWVDMLLNFKQYNRGLTAN